MRKSFINNGFALSLLWAVCLFASCLTAPDVADEGHTHGQEQSPGEHKSYTPDSNVLKLVKQVNREVVSTIPVITIQSERRIFPIQLQGIVNYDTRNNFSISSRISGRVEKLVIKYRFQQVKKGQLIMEIFSPEIASIQRELIYLQTSGGDPSLVEGARQKLMLLGVSEKDIETAMKKGEPLYRIPVYSPRSGYLIDNLASAVPVSPSMPAAPVAGIAGDAMGMGDVSPATNPQAAVVQQSAPVTLRVGQYVTAGQTLFNLYDDRSLIAEFFFPPDLARFAEKGKKLLFYPAGMPDQSQVGSIGMVQPIQRDGQNFTVVRVYLPKADLKTGQRLFGHMAITSQIHYWVPRQSVLKAGQEQIVFRKMDGLFKPVYVKTGLSMGEFVEILDDVSGWQIASNAYFLVDSESFIPAQSITGKSSANE